MDLRAGDPARYLGADDIVETDHSGVRALAAELRAAHPSDAAFARAAFEWVRDRVQHSIDAQDPQVTLTAGEVLDARVGLCYAKSHLLAAVTRAGGIPTGLCYQRLAGENGPVLHGLVAVHLDGRWHRQDPRGNRPGVDAQFRLGEERLAFPAGEGDLPEVHVSPSPAVVAALRGADDVLELCRNGLPAAP
ncbi:transglutaminase-like putative cysteine protease [Actinoplanes campanulatus]|uniref:Transglutaminase-like putative cysteine protease n=1 Tax=Actinoplanes campanulatus TaxID=113559 RepID=A0A7W5FEZ1_9ACTN|nr:transglutaminase family protein [Actinoplanes campanulatus]MBB3096068.1 transglutaminase-like putative cysteine protease [Actinoplanes campanulatus]GGN13482.1 transglutaminase [Actinoplanes campanulatus]GID36838.1 transglutaminase [Actinoplanes campanulatus]